MIKEYQQYENVRTIEDLTEKQKSSLLRIGAVTKSRNLLGENGRRLWKELYQRHTL